jgi:5,10-methylenetetrahydromethanopterin reductase
MASRAELGLLVLPERPVSELVDLARGAEDLGYDAIWVADEKFYRDPLVVLSAMATRTSRVTLGTGVTEPYARHPALIAMALGTLAELAPGRVVVGIGAGGPGFPPMGVIRRKPATALVEAVGIMRGLLVGERVDLEGEVLSFRGGSLNFPSRPLPIFVAARGERVLAAAGGIADGVIVAPFASRPAVEYAVGIVRRGARRAGRASPSIVARVDVSIAEEPERARDAVRYFVALPLWVSYPNWSYVQAIGARPPERARALMARRDYRDITEAANLLPPSMIDHFSIAGTADEVRQRIAELLPLVDQLVVHPVPAAGWSMARLVAAIAEVWKEATA